MDSSAPPTDVFGTPTPPEQPETLNPWLSIWFHPRRTINYVTSYRYSGRPVLLLAALGGIQALFDSMLEGDTSLLAALGGSVVLGSIFGILGLYLSAWITGWAARWLGGEAYNEDIRAAYAWSFLPRISLLVLVTLPSLLLSGSEIASLSEAQLDARMASDPAFTAVVVAFGLFVLIALAVMSIWSFVILITTLSEVNRFSIWRAILSLMLPGLIVFGVFLGLGVILGLFGMLLG